MRLTLTNIGKRYQYHWIFRNIDLEVIEGQCINISGSNGSGKSTLLRIMSGFLTPSEGKVIFEKDGSRVNDFYQHISFAAPYVDLIHQMTLQEQIDFHQNFKSFKANLDTNAVIEILDLKGAKHKLLKDFSSGMLQRVRLALAVLTISDICILDEPSSNLDKSGYEWYTELLKSYQLDSALVIASNEEKDFLFEAQALNIMHYK